MAHRVRTVLREALRRLIAIDDVSLTNPGGPSWLMFNANECSPVSAPSVSLRLLGLILRISASFDATSPGEFAYCSLAAVVWRRRSPRVRLSVA